MLSIGEQREVEFKLLSKLLVLLNAVRTDTKNRCTQILNFLLTISKRTGFARTAWSIVFG